MVLFWAQVLVLTPSYFSFNSSYRREDSGLLLYKEHLPVSQVAVGDTNRPGSQAKLTVGPLRCQGDSKCWWSCINTVCIMELYFFLQHWAAISSIWVMGVLSDVLQTYLWKWILSLSAGIQWSFQGTGQKEIQPKCTLKHRGASRVERNVLKSMAKYKFTGWQLKISVVEQINPGSS